MNYLVTRAEYGSPKFREHCTLVAGVYKRKGFIQGNTPIIDAHDTEHTSYFLITQRNTGVAVGTFRLIPGEIWLPVCSLYPRLYIERIQHRFVEASRVVSQVKVFSGYRDPTQQLMFRVVIESLAYAHAHALLGVVSLGSPEVFAWINRTFLGCQHALAPATWHRGGVVIPSLIWVDEFEECIQRNERLQTYFSQALAAY